MGKRSPADARLTASLERRAAAEIGDGGPIPQRWQQDPTWRCPNHHVSKDFTTGRRGARVCVFRYCGQLVQLSFPEDRSGPL